MGSRVPPAVTSTRTPASGRGSPGGSTASTAASSVGGLGQPAGAPLAPRAQGAGAGLEHGRRRARAASPRWPAWPGAPTCGCSSPGPRAAGRWRPARRVVSRLSASPCASLAMRVRGGRRDQVGVGVGARARGARAGRGRAAPGRGRRRAPGRARTRRVRTGAPVRPAKDARPTKRSLVVGADHADGVPGRSPAAPAPAPCRRRCPPETPRSRRAMALGPYR